MTKYVIAGQPPDWCGIGIRFQTNTAFGIGVAPMHFDRTQHFHPRMGWAFFGVRFGIHLGIRLGFAVSLETVFDGTYE